jgi:VanZ family protein
MPALGVTIWILIAGTSRNAPPGPQVSDKVLHFAAFATCSVLYVPVVSLWRRLDGARWRFFWAGALSLSLGAVLELWQSLLPFRSADWDDLWADTAGATVGACSALLLWRVLPALRERQTGQQP